MTRRKTPAGRSAAPAARRRAGKATERQVASSRRPPPRPAQRATRRPAPKKNEGSPSGRLTVTEVEALDDLRRELERLSTTTPRLNADPADVQKSVAHLVLTLVEFIRKVLERQAIRRMEAGTLTPRQTEEVGRALMLLEETLREMAGRFGIDADELNLELGPLGRLM